MYRTEYFIWQQQREMLPTVTPSERLANIEHEKAISPTLESLWPLIAGLFDQEQRLKSKSLSILVGRMSGKEALRN